MTPKPLWGLTFALLLIGALPGCATYRKCGFEGCPGDGSITADVQKAFSQHPELGPPNSINVQTLNGVIYLSGLVGEGLDKRTAGEVAASAPGVARVDNEIAISR